MCDICGRYHCHASCPCADVKSVATCDECGAEIFPGDLYYAFTDIIVCQNCVESHGLIADEDFDEGVDEW